MYSVGQKFRQIISATRVETDPVRCAWHTALASFGLFALELAMIRWTAGQIRIFAYFNNLVLIAAFLGSGVGAVLGRRFPGLIHFALPVLLIVSIPLALSEQLHLVHMQFPDAGMFLWTKLPTFTMLQYALHLGVFLLLVVLIALVFVCCGATLGGLMARQKQLRGYTWNLVGGIAGIAVFTCATYLDAPPPVWLLLGGIPFVALSRTKISTVSLFLVAILGGYSIDGAAYSPYNRIDVRKQADYVELNVNREYHQNIYDLSDGYLATRPESASLRSVRMAYDLPYQVNSSRESALIVGAGTGNDVQAALRNGYKMVRAVDIDAQLIHLGKQLHPERPYDQPGVVPVVEDARVFFERYQGAPFDVVSYGLLDSHAMFSAMSTLRLDNYVYTVEGIRAAWRHVAPRGHMSISFSVFAGSWIVERLYRTIEVATGREPIVVYTGVNYGATFIVAPQMERLDRTLLDRYEQLLPQNRDVKVVTDDWPFLYLRPNCFPWGYVVMLCAVVALTMIALPLIFGGAHELAKRFDPALFFMGAGFMLLEARGITSLSLVFGSTWIVNAAIFFGIMVVALLANQLVERLSPQNSWIWFGGLFLALAGLWFFDNAWLSQLPILIRGGLGGVVNVLPIAFAGIIFSTLLAESAAVEISLGSNLIGAVLGGCMEYLAMAVGQRSLVLVAGLFYALALWCARRRAGGH